jgi:DNA polymerase III alpha subunit
VSFESAYLRAHYPAEFMAAVISNEGGFYSPFAYLSEARRMGLTVLPPDVNASEWDNIGQARTIRMGLMHIKGLRRELVERLVQERAANGSFRSFHDLLTRVRLELAQVRLLIKAGCCDSVAGELTRPALVWRALAMSQSAKQPSFLYRDGTQDRSVPGPLPIPEEYSEERQVQDEIACFRFPLRCHPLALYDDIMEELDPIAACDLERYVGKSVTLVGCLLTEKMAETKHGEPMEFLTFEDQTAMYDATLFPDAYRRYCHVLASEKGYVVRGLVEESFGAVTLTITELQLLRWPRASSSDDETPTSVLTLGEPDDRQDADRHGQ